MPEPIVGAPVEVLAAVDCGELTAGVGLIDDEGVEETGPLGTEGAGGGDDGTGPAVEDLADSAALAGFSAISAGLDGLSEACAGLAAAAAPLSKTW